MPNDPHNLQRFLDAQERMYSTALKELQEGKKRGHWMWFIFPQTSKPGMSFVSRRFAIRSLDEAKAYLEHPVLGSRVLECTKIVQAHDVPLLKLFGNELDVMKFESCMRLFVHVGGENSVFESVLKDKNIWVKEKICKDTNGIN